MPVVNFEQYCNMLDRAYKNNYAYPAFNISNMETINAVFMGLKMANSDGIIQVSIGGASYASGQNINDSVVGAIALSNYVHSIADKYDVNVALHTDHCRNKDLNSFLLPLVEETEKRRQKGLPNLFNSHMFDGSDISLDENLTISKKLLARCSKNDIILEVEIGVVGGEEDGVNNEDTPNKKLYSTPEDILKAFENLHKISRNFLMAATFGNVHGVYKPGNVKLKPEVLLNGKNIVAKKYGKNENLKFVFHGGSGSSRSDIKQTLEYGVVKMNVDTDTQYAFTRPIADHFFKNYDGVLKIEGEVGIKSKYDPRSYLKKAQQNMAKKVLDVCKSLDCVDSHIKL